MARTRRLGETPEQKIRRLWHEEADGSLTIQTKQDVTDLVELTKEEQKESDGQKYNDFRTLVARIPTATYYRIIAGATCEEERDMRIVAWLNDDANKAFRSKLGRI